MYITPTSPPDLTIDAQVVGDEHHRHLCFPFCIAVSSSRICVWMETSSADTASSATSSTGESNISAREAIPRAAAGRRRTRAESGCIGAFIQAHEFLGAEAAFALASEAETPCAIGSDGQHLAGSCGAWVERGKRRILENHLDIGSHRPKGIAGHGRDITTIEQGFLPLSDSIKLQQRTRPSEDLAGAGFTDDAEGSALADREADVVDRAFTVRPFGKEPARRLVRLAEVPENFQHDRRYSAAPSRSLGGHARHSGDQVRFV
ncbi:MAG: hypothetical protein U5N27_21365 [Rhizobium sp.]|nr:hypothetical protein [Rhizobium sp.]